MRRDLKELRACTVFLQCNQHANQAVRPVRVAMDVVSRCHYRKGYLCGTVTGVGCRAP